MRKKGDWSTSSCLVSPHVELRLHLDVLSIISLVLILGLHHVELSTLSVLILQKSGRGRETDTMSCAVSKYICYMIKYSSICTTL